MDSLIRGYLYKEQYLLWTLYKIKVEKSAQSVPNVCGHCVYDCGMFIHIFE